MLFRTPDLLISCFQSARYRFRHHDLQPQIRHPPARQVPRLCRRRPPHARARHRRLHGDVQHRRRRPAAAAAVPRAGPAWSGSRTTARAACPARTTRADTFNGWREQNKSFEALAGVLRLLRLRRRQTLTGAGEPERLRAVGVSDNFLDVLGVPLAARTQLHGRGMPLQRPARSPSSAMRSGSAVSPAIPPIVGRALTLNNKPTTIVGVLPRVVRLRRDLLAGQEIDLIPPFPLTPGNGAAGQHALRHRPAQAGRHRRTRRRPSSRVISQRFKQSINYGGTFGARVSPLERRAARQLPAGVLRPGRRRGVRARHRLRQSLQPPARPHQRAPAGVRGARRPRRAAGATSSSRR